VHGQLKGAEKDRVMAQSQAMVGCGRDNVVEVGVDVPPRPSW